MLTFWIIAALLMLLAFWFILPALLNKPGSDEDIERREANVLVYKDQNRELKADLKNGLIGEKQYKAEISELERRLLEDVTAKSAAVFMVPAVPVATRATTGTVVPVTSSVLRSKATARRVPPAVKTRCPLAT